MRLRTAFMASLLLGSFTASAGDTVISRLHALDPKIQQALEKDNLHLTKLLRERFAGKTISDIEKYAKSKKLNADALVSAVHQAGVMQVGPVGPELAWVLVERCKLQGLDAFASARVDVLEKCINDSQASDNLLKKVPTAEELTSYLATAKMVNAPAPTGSERELPLIRLKGLDAGVLEAFTKKGWENNTDVVKHLSLSSERDAFAKAKKLSNALVDQSFALCDFTRLASVTPPAAMLFWDAGVKNMGELGSQNVEAFQKKLADTNVTTKRLAKDLTVEELTAIVSNAKSLKQHK